MVWEALNGASSRRASCRGGTWRSNPMQNQFWNGGGRMPKSTGTSRKSIGQPSNQSMLFAEGSLAFRPGH